MSDHSSLGSSLVIDREPPILCYVTNRWSLFAPPGVPEESALVDKIATIAAAGVNWVQIREKDLSGRQVAEITRESIARVRRAARIIVNDRLDVAITEGAGGVHLGEAGLPAAQVAKLVESEEFLIGASCHSLEGSIAAARDGADYIVFGPVFATPSKAKSGEPQGVKKLRTVCGAVALPVIAIGGITLENASECVAAGAAGIAAIRLFQDAKEPAEIVSSLKKLQRTR